MTCASLYQAASFFHAPLPPPHDLRVLAPEPARSVRTGLQRFATGVTAPRLCRPRVLCSGASVARHEHQGCWRFAKAFPARDEFVALLEAAANAYPVSISIDNETADTHVSMPDENNSSEPLTIAMRLTREFPHLVRLISKPGRSRPTDHLGRPKPRSAEPLPRDD